MLNLAVHEAITGLQRNNQLPTHRYVPDPDAADWTPCGWTLTVALGCQPAVQLTVRWQLSSWQSGDNCPLSWIQGRSAENGDGVNRDCCVAIGWLLIGKLMVVHLIQIFLALHCRVESYPEPAESGSWPLAVFM